MTQSQHDTPQNEAGGASDEGSESLEVPHRHHSTFYMALRKAELQQQGERYSTAHKAQMMDLVFA